MLETNVKECEERGPGRREKKREKRRTEREEKRSERGKEKKREGLREKNIIRKLDFIKYSHQSKIFVSIVLLLPLTPHTSYSLSILMWIELV